MEIDIEAINDLEYDESISHGFVVLTGGREGRKRDVELTLDDEGGGYPGRFQGPYLRREDIETILKLRQDLVKSLVLQLRLSEEKLSLGREGSKLVIRKNVPQVVRTDDQVKTSRNARIQECGDFIGNRVGQILQSRISEEEFRGKLNELLQMDGWKKVLGLKVGIISSGDFGEQNLGLANSSLIRERKNFMAEAMDLADMQVRRFLADLGEFTRQYGEGLQKDYLLRTVKQACLRIGVPACRTNVDERVLTTRLAMKYSLAHLDKMSFRLFRPDNRAALDASRDTRTEELAVVDTPDGESDGYLHRGEYDRVIPKDFF
ncbi:MAG: hypothetical protein ABII07_03715 [Patescibacteria group bacterium]|nr:hypothetical protein [Patescibacteria group bacterium]